ncbi:UDP-N-acetylglucosamine 2-epimerase [Azospira restricta]|uniref:UDP-N-acetylglucosamine 2-epimerase (Hydrolyzing) n=1 Tax=Azospira restricta TaxID=404405 RepID=A0A974SPH4_9RHOO|nr:UDP-N-acetylglucosamine 2-epimerase [Azospira restricta]QRJ64048.1 UDP-N-acetylglucosamine 2-epimerase (hydrolyzing) [Azospira restricta]
MRRICYVTGTRADFGLMRRTLEAIRDSGDLGLSIVATGMHLDERYGLTIREIEAAGLPVSARVDLEGARVTDGATMARDVGRMTIGMVEAFQRIAPDIVLLLGDRGEMLAGAIAALHLNIPIAHVHGGERSGTIDESVRHAISKLSHFHFVATEESRTRLVRMGERPERIHVTGAPGLDGIEEDASIGRGDLLAGMKLDPLRPVALFVFHPVVQEAECAGADASEILACLARHGLQLVALRPNSDAGSSEVVLALERWRHDPSVRVVTHLPRDAFVSWMAAADLMVGNSSAGIIEAASFGTPVINVGSRQNLRERNANVIDVEARAEALDGAVRRALQCGHFAIRNIYGDGHAGGRIVSHLRGLPLDPSVLSKANAY